MINQPSEHYNDHGHWHALNSSIIDHWRELNTSTNQAYLSYRSNKYTGIKRYIAPMKTTTNSDGKKTRIYNFNLEYRLYPSEVEFMIYHSMVSHRNNNVQNSISSNIELIKNISDDTEITFASLQQKDWTKKIESACDTAIKSAMTGKKHYVVLYDFHNADHLYHPTYSAYIFEPNAHNQIAVKSIFVNDGYTYNQYKSEPLHTVFAKQIKKCMGNDNFEITPLNISTDYSIHSGLMVAFVIGQYEAPSHPLKSKAGQDHSIQSDDIHKPDYNMFALEAFAHMEYSASILGMNDSITEYQPIQGISGRSITNNVVTNNYNYLQLAFYNRSIYVPPMASSPKNDNENSLSSTSLSNRIEVTKRANSTNILELIPQKNNFTDREYSKGESRNKKACVIS